MPESDLLLIIDRSSVISAMCSVRLARIKDAFVANDDVPIGPVFLRRHGDRPHSQARLFS